MPRISYVNGQYLPHTRAMVSVEDRGYQLADGVYEVIAIYNGNLVDRQNHLGRLERSLQQLRIDMPVNVTALKFIMAETIRKNRILNGKLYLQITRGVAPRDHAFPTNCKSSLVVTVSPVSWPSREDSKKGGTVITSADIRWKRVDVKSVSLLPNVLAKQEAIDASADENWLVDEEGFVTEGTASNAWIVTHNNQLVTRQTDEHILAGITRETILKLVDEEGIDVVERPFTVIEAQTAKEAFFTSSTAFIKPVVSIDNVSVGNGDSGLMTCTLIDRYFDLIENQSEVD